MSLEQILREFKLFIRGLFSRRKPPPTPPMLGRLDPLGCCAACKAPLGAAHFEAESRLFCCRQCVPASWADKMRFLSGALLIALLLASVASAQIAPRIVFRPVGAGFDVRMGTQYLMTYNMTEASARAVAGIVAACPSCGVQVETPLSRWGGFGDIRECLRALEEFQLAQLFFVGAVIANRVPSYGALIGFIAASKTLYEKANAVQRACGVSFR